MSSSPWKHFLSLFLPIIFTKFVLCTLRFLNRVALGVDFFDSAGLACFLRQFEWGFKRNTVFERVRKQASRAPLGMSPPPSQSIPPPKKTLRQLCILKCLRIAPFSIIPSSPIRICFLVRKLRDIRTFCASDRNSLEITRYWK